MTCVNADKYVTNQYGYTSKNPCGVVGGGDRSRSYLQNCTQDITRSWIKQKDKVVADMRHAFEQMNAIEKSKGVSTFTSRYAKDVARIAVRAMAVGDEPYIVDSPGGWLGEMYPFAPVIPGAIDRVFGGSNAEIVSECVAILRDAGCMLEELNAAIKTYNEKPRDTTARTTSTAPTGPVLTTPGAPGVPSGATPPRTPPPTLAQRVGEDVMILAGIAFVGGALYLYSQGKFGRRGGRSSATFLAVPGTK